MAKLPCEARDRQPPLDIPTLARGARDSLLAKVDRPRLAPGSTYITPRAPLPLSDSRRTLRHPCSGTDVARSASGSPLGQYPPSDPWSVSRLLATWAHG